jgi:predicted Fe-Mo cluster-binding NifX family protein
LSKIALSVCRGRIAPVFDVSRQILVAEIEEGAVVAQATQTIAGDDPIGKASTLVRWGVETLICGAISRPLASLLAAYGIRTVGFTAGAVEEVICAYLDRALPCPTLAMPGCCCRKRLRANPDDAQSSGATAREGAKRSQKRRKKHAAT